MSIQQHVTLAADYAGDYVMIVDIVFLAAVSPSSSSKDKVFNILDKLHVLKYKNQYYSS